MRFIALLIGIAAIFLMLIDAFETILQPRRITHRFRYARLFYRATWKIWRLVGLRISAGKRREAFLSIFGPFSLLGLFVTWIIGLIVGFAILHWSIESPLHAGSSMSFQSYLYLSGTTFFTLGYGDITPTALVGRILAVIESGLGFAFLAVIIGYLPVLYQAYASREKMISLLDARAGSPPSALQVLMRAGRAGRIERLEKFLEEWERWAGELLESHLSFPVLSYYRSQHDNQSWLAALVMILDTCALLLAEVKGADPYQAQLTFAMARHAAVDLSLVLKTSPKTNSHNRLGGEGCEQLHAILKKSGVELHDSDDADRKLAELRAMYEPFVNALAERLVFALPPIVTDETTVDNWQRSSIGRSPGIGALPGADSDHF